MPQLKGTELLKVLSNPPKTIFTTAHADYAIESYELEAVDYLLKPVQFDRFLKAVNKLFRPGNVTTIVTEAIQEKPVAAGSYIYLRSDRKMMKVMLNDIGYIESMKDYVKVFTSSGVIITRQSIAAMCAMLPEKEFIRIHRSFIVNAAKITSYTGELISVNGTEIPIGKLFRQGVMKQLGAD
jgi:DNA-binding LytR/AlgR family response regulator